MSSTADSIERERVPQADAVARDFCERMLPSVSRTFALSIQCLPRELSDAVCVAYLLCRIVDTIEDDRGVTPLQRRALFAAFDAALTGAAAGDLHTAVAFQGRVVSTKLGAGAERELACGAPEVFLVFASLPASQRHAIEPRVLEMSSGMQAYSRRAEAEGGLRLRDLEDLERYCYYVAGTVGAFLTDLFLLECPVEERVRLEVDARTNSFGLGLQLVNILKDVAEDLARGDCFLPLSVAAAHGVDLSRLLEPSQRARGIALLRSLTARTREHLVEAEGYALLWPVTPVGREIRLFCAGPIALALGTLREVELADTALVTGAAPTVSRAFVAEVFHCIREAVAAPERAESDRLLLRVFNRSRVGISGPPRRPDVPLWKSVVRE